MYPWTGRSGRSNRHGPISPISCGSIWNRDVRAEAEGRLAKFQPSIEGMRTRTARGPRDRRICAPAFRGDMCQSSSIGEDAPDHRWSEAPVVGGWTCLGIWSFGWRPVHSLNNSIEVLVKMSFSDLEDEFDYVPVMAYQFPTVNNLQSSSWATRYSKTVPS